MNKIFVESLKDAVGDEIKEVFYLSSIEKCFGSKEHYRLKLRDNSGTITGIIWPNYINENYLNMADNVVFVEGTITTYMGEVQITVEKLSIVDNFNPMDFCPIGDNLVVYENKLIELIEGIQKTHIKELLYKFFHNDSIMNRFKTLQGGSKVHHVCIGGVLIHTINVVKTCLEVASHYVHHNNFDLDILVAAALLHDIGKIKEYEPFPINRKTTAGRMLGHIIMGNNMVYMAIKENESFPEEDAIKLLHCLATHHGTIDTIIPAMCVEAVILSRADELDARVDCFNNIINSNQDNKEILSFDRTIKQYVYKG